MLAAARSLAGAGFRVGAVAAHPHAATHWSRACWRRYVAPDPRLDAGAFVEALARIFESAAFSMLIPGSDAALLAISSHRVDLPPWALRGLPPHPAVDASLDKRRLAEAAQTAGLPQPPSVACATLEQALDAARAIGFPVLLKPRSTVFAAPDGSLRQRSSRIVRDERELRTLASEYGFPCLVQGRLAGEVFSLGGVMAETGIAPAVMARYERTWPPAAGNAAYAATVEPPRPLVSRAGRLLEAVGWRGLFELELIRRSRDSFVPIDLNPRPYGSLALASAAGAPLAVEWCRFLTGERPSRVAARPGYRYRWEEAELRHLWWSLRRGRLRAALAALRPRRRTVHAYFHWRDPAPLAAWALGGGGRLIASRRGRSAISPRV